MHMCYMYIYIFINLTFPWFFSILVHLSEVTAIKNSFTSLRIDKSSKRAKSSPQDSKDFSNLSSLAPPKQETIFLYITSSMFGLICLLNCPYISIIISHSCLQISVILTGLFPVSWLSGPSLIILNLTSLPILLIHLHNTCFPQSRLLF